MISANEIVLCGRRSFHRLWDPGGKPYTSMWITINVPGLGHEEVSILCEVTVNENQINGGALKAIMAKLDNLKSDAWVLVRGQVVNKDKKEGGKKSAFRVPLGSVEVLSGEQSPFNECFVAGDIEQRVPNGMVVGFSYHNPKAKEWKKRMVPVTIPAEGQYGFDLLHRNALQGLQTAKRVAVTGLLRPKDNAGNDMVNVYATCIIPIG